MRGGSIISSQFPLLTVNVLLGGEVDPVGEHDRDHHQAREARHDGEHAGVQLWVIRLAVVSILLSIPEHYRAGQGMSSYVSRTPTRQRRQ